LLPFLFALFNVWSYAGQKEDVNSFKTFFDGKGDALICKRPSDCGPDTALLLISDRAHIYPESSFLRPQIISENQYLNTVFRAYEAYQESKDTSRVGR